MNVNSNLEAGKANLVVFSETLTELARRNKNVIVVTSDSRGSGKLLPYAQTVPDQIIEVGIAEQNLVGVAAGLAASGKIVYAVSPASFLTARSLEQIKNDVCYSNQPVNLIGISGGVSYGALGSTHHSTHEVAALRAIHNITIILPADNFETEQAIKASALMPSPVYIRFGKNPMYHLHPAETKFQIGKAITIREGTDVAFIATGETVYHALTAAIQLETQGYSARVISMHTIKPLDTEVILKAATQCKTVVTVEEHSVCGGLGEACAATLMQAAINPPFKIVGFPDEDMVTGSQREIFDHYGINGPALAKTAASLLKK